MRHQIEVILGRRGDFLCAPHQHNAPAGYDRSLPNTPKEGNRLLRKSIEYRPCTRQSAVQEADQEVDMAEARIVCSTSKLSIAFHC